MILFHLCTDWVGLCYQEENEELQVTRRNGSNEHEPFKTLGSRYICGQKFKIGGGHTKHYIQWAFQVAGDFFMFEGQAREKRQKRKKVQTCLYKFSDAVELDCYF